MPRITDQTYLANYDALRDEYLRGGQSFIRLEPHEQWALFGFYQHHERHSHKELVIYRREISPLNPSLPQQAGKAFRHWQELRAAPPPAPMRESKAAAFSLGFQVRPEPDVKQFARALIELAKYLRAEQDAHEAPESEPPAPADDSQSSEHQS